MRPKLFALFLLLCTSTFFLFTSSCFGQSSISSDINQLTDCQKLVNTGKTQAEKDELQKDYWILLGIITDLSNYRQMFLQEGNFIDLFPTTYYHVTYLEMQKLLALSFTYPIETMKQMISFYDAYKWNRNQWDKGNKSIVEEHWEKHFEYTEERLANADLFCAWIGKVLGSSIDSHVNYDLARAIRYAFNNRFDQSISSLADEKLKADFDITNNLFNAAVAKTTMDIEKSKNHICPDEYLDDITNSSNNGQLYGTFLIKIVNLFPGQDVLTSKDVIVMRQKAWNKAASSDTFFESSETVMSPQPVLSHNSLIEIGKNLCPPDPATEEHHKELLGTWFGHVSDMYTHKCQPQPIQITIHKFTKDSVILTRINSGQKVPDTLFTAAPCRFTNNRQMTIYLSKDNAPSELYDSVQIGFAFDSINRQRLYGRPCFNYWVGATQLNQNSLVFSKKFTTNNHKLFDLIDIPNKDSLRFIGSLVGAATPDELARLLLKALQTNNKELWIDCIHPTTAQEYRDAVSNDFDVVHGSFEKGGITNWNLVQSYRLTYDTCRGCQPLDGSRLLLNFLIEFSYGKEASVAFSISRIHTYQGRYYTDGCRDCNVIVRQKN